MKVGVFFYLLIQKSVVVSWGYNDTTIYYYRFRDETTNFSIVSSTMINDAFSLHHIFLGWNAIVKMINFLYKNIFSSPLNTTKKYKKYPKTYNRVSQIHAVFSIILDLWNPYKRVNKLQPSSWTALFVNSILIIYHSHAIQWSVFKTCYFVALTSITFPYISWDKYKILYKRYWT